MNVVANQMNGLLLVDKPTGLTSHDVVHQARRTLGIRGIGHAGTLDPLASGLLILLVGEATKVSDYLLNGNKGYDFTVRLGVTTDSMDLTGEVTGEMPVTMTDERIREVASSLTGSLTLDIPVHSAVKVNGKKLYEFAHKGETPPEVPKREMYFYDTEVLAIERGDVSLVHLRTKCSKGSFIRAWAHHFGRVLGCGGTIERLRRTFSDPMRVEQAITLETLSAQWEARSERNGRVLGPAWVPLRDSLPHFQRIDIEGRDVTLLRNGQISKNMQIELLRYVQIGQAAPSIRVISRETNDLLALLLAEPGQFYKIKRVFQHV